MRDPERLGPYQVLAKLGEGGMGSVYKGRDPATGRVVAIKVLTYHGQDSEVAGRRFRREFRAAAKLRHPHVASVLDLCQEGELYFTMEYVEGLPLHRALASGQKLSADELNRPDRIALLVDTLGQVALALDYIHANLIVHRDLKPDNIMVTEAPEGPMAGTSSDIAGCRHFYEPTPEGKRPYAKLLDFGLARQLNLQSRLTKTGVIMGTVDYMSPEQVLGAEIDSRSDLYALGVVLYEALADRLPFSADETVTILLKHAYEPPPPIRASNPNVDPRLEDIAFKLLNKDPLDRYQTARELVADLIAFKRNARLVSSAGGERHTAVSSELPALQRGRLFAPRAIGREREQGALRDALAATLNGQGGVFLLSGETGVGKTRLAEEAKKLARLKGLDVHAGAAYEDQPLPYGPFLVALEPVAHALASTDADRLGRLLPPEARALATLSQRFLDIEALRALPPLVDLSPDQHKYRLFGAVAGLLRRLARETPQLLVLEDLQWSDVPTLELVQYLVRNVVHAEREISDASAQAPLSILITVRDEDLDPAGALCKLIASLRRSPQVTELKLQRLNRDEVVLMLRSMLGRDDAPADLVDWVHGETQGNPFFIEEVMGGLVADGVLVSAGGRWKLRRARGGLAGTGTTGQVPSGIRDLIKKRLEKLDETALKVATAAAVIGAELSFDVLMAVAELEEDELLDVVDVLMKAKILHESPRDPEILAFSYGKVREILLEDVMERRKRRIHEKVGRALEARSTGRPEDTIALAHHFLLGHNVAKALAYLPRAGRLHMERYNNEEAVKCFCRVLDLADDLPEGETALPLDERLETLKMLGETQSLLCAYDRALAAFGTLGRLAHESGRAAMEARALNAQADVHLRRGDYDDASRLVAEALEKFGAAGDDLGKAAAVNNLGRIAWHHGRMDEARKAFEEALEIRRALNDTYGVALGYNNIGYVYFAQGDYREAMHYYREALAMWRATGNRRGVAKSLEGIANVAQRRGSYREALEHLEEAIRTSRELGDKAGVGYCLISIGNVHGYLGQYPQALEHYAESHELYTELGEIRGISICLGNLARVLTALGDYREALEHVGRSLKLARKIGEQEEVAIGLMSIADIYREYGDFAEALRNYGPSIALFRAQGETFGLSLALVGCAEARLALGDVETAGGEIDEALVIARGNGAREVEARALVVSAEIHGRMDEAREAQAIADTLGSAEVRCAARAVVAKLAREVGAREVTLNALRDAVQIVEELADGFDAYQQGFLKRRVIRSLFLQLEEIEMQIAAESTSAVDRPEVAAG